MSLQPDHLLPPAQSTAADGELAMMGYVSGVFGTRGWLKIHSYTRPRSNLLDYPGWLLGSSAGWKAVKILESKSQGPSLLVSFAGIGTREEAEPLVRLQIAIPRANLPVLPAQQYYWSDLLGLNVVNVDGHNFGRVVRMMEAGDHDVMVSRADRDYLIPFVRERYVLNVDLDTGKILVDWHIDD